MIEDNYNASYAFKEDGKASTKFLAKTFGYVGIGIAISAIVAFLYSFLLMKVFPLSEGSEAFYSGLKLSYQGFLVAVVSAVIALIVSWIATFVSNMVSIRTHRAPWVGFIIYALAMGFLFAAIILIPGVTYGMIGQAFGISAGMFLVMFLIGYFSKADLTIFAFIGFALLFGLMMSSGVFFIVSWVTGAFQWYYLITSIVVIIAELLFIGFDAYRIKQIAERGMENNNLALFCAFSLYSDFITLVLHVLRILMMAKSRN